MVGDQAIVTLVIVTVGATKEMCRLKVENRKLRESVASVKAAMIFFVGNSTSVTVDDGFPRADGGRGDDESMLSRLEEQSVNDPGNTVLLAQALLSDGKETSVQHGGGEQNLPGTCRAPCWWEVGCEDCGLVGSGL